MSDILDSGERRMKPERNKNGDKRGCYITHGMSKTRLYEIWTDMKKRCYNPKNKRYNRYGLRGIGVCDDWKNSFANFANWALKNGYSDELTLERKDIDKDYCPKNCSWIPFALQQRNTSRSHFITINGETKCMTEWAEIYNIDRDVIKDRINKLHWNPVMAVTFPKVKSRKEFIAWKKKNQNVDSSTIATETK